LTHSQQTLNLPIDQLAREIGVGMSTLSQFCQTLGYKGFKNFKLDLAAELKTPFEMDRSIIATGDSLEEITRKALSANVDALLNTHKGLDKIELIRALKAIREAQRIDLYGFGVSATVGLDAYNRFLSLGLHTNWLPDIAHVTISATVLKKGDLAIAFSYSGENELITQTFKKVRQAGATTLAITGNRSSPTALHADIVLQVFSSEPTPFISNLYTSGRMAMLSIVDMLCLGLLYSSEPALDQLEQIGDAMEQFTRPLEK
jgi:DNA-binding MurR/RpiR family transcriptional regulator